MAHVIPRRDFGTILFEIMKGVGTNPDANFDYIEAILNSYGFKVRAGTKEEDYQMQLIDEVE